MKWSTARSPLGRFSASAKLAGVLLAWALLMSGCSSVSKLRDVAPPPTSTSPSSPSPIDTAYHPKRNDLALFALSLLDTPYSWGGRGPATGFDCSGLVSHVYREAAGLPVRGSSADLGKKTRPVDPSRIQPGDLLFFNTLGARHSHVGIYVGDGRFVHASNPRTGVRVDQLNNRYYAQRFEGAGTLLD
ncbi:C40 family peptidase [Limnohabitans sp. 15K]|uniref:C40 family peptidase n=1 Tax=Limnohabitans sp. 15K TaxID=1100706 RepID=UPI001E63DAE7|nr:C40 family peptidase [Limnohabitans sp. 15K]